MLPERVQWGDVVGHNVAPIASYESSDHCYITKQSPDTIKHHQIIVVNYIGEVKYSMILDRNQVLYLVRRHFAKLVACRDALKILHRTRRLASS